jgi:hypothetical protein
MISALQLIGTVDRRGCTPKARIPISRLFIGLQDQLPASLVAVDVDDTLLCISNPAIDDNVPAVPTRSTGRGNLTSILHTQMAIPFHCQAWLCTEISHQGREVQFRPHLKQGRCRS